MIKLTEGLNKKDIIVDIEGIQRADCSDSVAWLRAALMSIMKDVITYKRTKNYREYAGALKEAADQLSAAAKAAKNEAEADEERKNLNTPNIRALHEAMEAIPEIEPWSTLIQNKVNEVLKYRGVEEAEHLAKYFHKEFCLLKTRYGLSKIPDFSSKRERTYIETTFRNIWLGLNSYDSSLITYESEGTMFWAFLPYLSKLELRLKPDAENIEV